MAGDASREDLFAALWALVWAGEVTNDLWLPLRGPTPLPALTRPASGRPAGRRLVPAGPGRAVGGLRPVVAGRAACSPMRRPPDERRRALAELLVERHGVLTRSATLARGRARRIRRGVPRPQRHGDARRLPAGYFVEGLGGAQFASPGAVERLRDLRDPPPDAPPHVVVLGAADPAQPYGAAVPWPRRDAARVAVAGLRRDGRAGGRPPALYLERGGRGLLTFASPDDRALEPALAALADWVRGDRRRRAAIERVDGEPVFGSPLEAPLAAAGRADLRAMVLRA